MRSAFRSIAAVAAVGLGGRASPDLRAEADVAPTQPVALAVLNLDYVDTSGEPADQTAAHQRRAADFVSALQRDLAANGQYRIVPISCGAAPCNSGDEPGRVEKAARAAGAKLVLIGGVHKMSTLVQWAKIEIADEEQGRIVFDRLVTFRGDTDEAWQKAESFVARDVLRSERDGRRGRLTRRRSNSRSSISSSRISAAGLGSSPKATDDRKQLIRATEDRAAAADRIRPVQPCRRQPRRRAGRGRPHACTNATVATPPSPASSARTNPLLAS